MVMDTTAVLNYRLPMLHSMATEPAIFWTSAKWFETNRMVSEKMFAFSQSYMLMVMNLAQLPYGRLPSAKKVLQLQRKILKPVRTTLSANARRAKKKN